MESLLNFLIPETVDGSTPITVSRIDITPGPITRCSHQIHYLSIDKQFQELMLMGCLRIVTFLTADNDRLAACYYDERAMARGQCDAHLHWHIGAKFNLLHHHDSFDCTNTMASSNSSVQQNPPAVTPQSDTITYLRLSLVGIVVQTFTHVGHGICICWLASIIGPPHHILMRSTPCNNTTGWSAILIG